MDYFINFLRKKNSFKILYYAYIYTYFYHVIPVIIFHFEGMSFSSAHDLKQWDFLDNNEIFSEFAQFIRQHILTILTIILLQNGCLNCCLVVRQNGMSVQRCFFEISVLTMFYHAVSFPMLGTDITEHKILFLVVFKP